MNLFEKWREEEYRNYEEDLKIATGELTSMKLYPVEGRIICDLYAIPSHNNQSYFAIVYEKDGRYDMVYAKPQLYDPISHEYIRMYRFKDAKEARNHSAKDGKIIMGMKHLSDEFANLINDVVSNWPMVRHKDEGFVLDGCFQAIRVYKGAEICGEVVFKCADELIFPEGKEYLSAVLDDLYLKVGELIE